MKTLAYSIPNINCQHCVMTITKALEALPEVEFIEADPATKTLTVEGSDQLCDKTIRQKLDEIGFSAK